ncbi:hypothetical protein CsSME_00001868 [Camellia sinensis var. sinensis]
MHYIINTAFDTPYSYTTHGTDTLHLIYWPLPSYTAIIHRSRHSYTAHSIHTLYSHTAPFQIPATAGGAGRGTPAYSGGRTGRAHTGRGSESRVRVVQDGDEARDGSGSDSSSGADGGNFGPSSRKRTRRASRS